MLRLLKRFNLTYGPSVRTGHLSLRYWIMNKHLIRKSVYWQSIIPICADKIEDSRLEEEDSRLEKESGNRQRVNKVRSARLASFGCLFVTIAKRALLGDRHVNHVVWFQRASSPSRAAYP